MGKRKILSILCPALAMTALILDTKTALQAGAQGVALCLQTLIPSLFPFFLISNLLTASLPGIKIPPIERLLRIPSGGGSLFLIGLLGGYPVGAQSIAQARNKELLSAQDARRLLAFCNNAGPAFLFGIGARLFGDSRLCWLLWAVHIVSAVTVGCMTPGTPEIQPKTIPNTGLTLPQALRKSVETMALVCGWVLIFRVLLGFLKRWFLWLLPLEAEIFLCGLFELANGCCRLPELANIGLRFTLCAVFLGFGGLCVALQTRSVAGNIDTALYLPGKIAQGAVSYLLSIPCQLAFPAGERTALSGYLAVLCILICMIYGFIGRKQKIRGRNLGQLRV